MNNEMYSPVWQYVLYPLLPPIIIGGITGVDGCIYAPPYTATGVLRINPRTDSVQVLGNYPAGGWKWHGGLLAKSTGVIYAFPAHSNEVLCIDTNVRDDGGGDDDKDESWRVSTIPIHRHENDMDSPVPPQKRHI